MLKLKTDVNWNKHDKKDIEKPLVQFENYLMSKGLRKSTVESYVFRVSKYLQFTETTMPNTENFQEFHCDLMKRNLSRSSINNYLFAIKSYHEMKGCDPVEFAFIKPNNIIPTYFDAQEVEKIFDACYNIKHLAMLQTAFFGGLRASELCCLEDSDLDLDRLTIHIREGKGGQSGIAYITEEVETTLRQYLSIRPPHQVDWKQPLFYTDWGRRWDRKGLYHMFIAAKKRAGVTKKGGFHVFARHSSASIMISNGADVRIVQTLLRHKDIRTTLRYIIVTDQTARAWHSKTLRLDAVN